MSLYRIHSPDTYLNYTKEFDNDEECKKWIENYCPKGSQKAGSQFEYYTWNFYPIIALEILKNSF